MKKGSIKLHTNQRLTLLIAVSFAVLSFLLVTIVTLTTSGHFGNLITLNQSKYQYSAITSKAYGHDNYYLINAGIVFSCSNELEKGINADAVMQTADFISTDMVPWRVEKLDVSEVAISRNVARSYGVNTGDILYSKHAVDGQVYKYTIKQVLPSISSFSASLGSSYSDGVIIMGYDGQYIENISHTAIAFTNEPIEQLIERFSETPVNIVYRDDEIAAERRQILPFLALTVVLAAALTVVFVYLLTHDVYCDFQRLIKLGFKKKELNHSYVIYIIQTFVLAELFLTLLSFVLLYVMNLSFEEMWLFITVLSVEFVSLFIAVAFSKWKVWRA